MLSIREKCANTSTDKSICWSICRLQGRPDCADWEGRGQDGGGWLQLQPQLSTVIAHHRQAKQVTSEAPVLLGNRCQPAVGEMKCKDQVYLKDDLKQMSTKFEQKMLKLGRFLYLLLLIGEYINC